MQARHFLEPAPYGANRFEVQEQTAEGTRRVAVFDRVADARAFTALPRVAAELEACARTVSETCVGGRDLAAVHAVPMVNRWRELLSLLSRAA